MVNGHDTEGLWISVSELARQRGVDKALVSRRIAKFEASGAIETRSGPQNAKLVQPAAYDRLCGDSVDAIRSAAQVPPPPPSGPRDPADPVLAREQARRVAYQADLAKLELDERLGRLVPADDVNRAFTEMGEAILQTLEQLPARADDVAAAVAKDGLHGARSILKTIVVDLRRSLAAAVARAGADTGESAAA